MKLVGNNKRKIDEKENGGNVPHLEIALEITSFSI